MTKNQVPITPLTMRIIWPGINGEDQENKTLAYLDTCTAAMIQAGGLRPCAMRLHAVDAYDLAAHPLFAPSYAPGQVLGRLHGMAVILDPYGIAAQAELVVCPGCRNEFPSCDYEAVTA